MSSFRELIQSKAKNVGATESFNTKSSQKYGGLIKIVTNYADKNKQEKWTPEGKITTEPGGDTKFQNFHPGIDIANKIGSPVKAYADGIVTRVVDGMKKGMASAGNYIVVEDGAGNKHKYSHLDKASVNPGQNVSSGQRIGTIGNTGNTYSPSGGDGAHLDYTIVNAFGKYVNPYEFLKT